MWCEFESLSIRRIYAKLSRPDGSTPVIPLELPAFLSTPYFMAKLLTKHGGINWHSWQSTASLHRVGLWLICFSFRFCSPTLLKEKNARKSTHYAVCIQPILWGASGLPLCLPRN
jgi:hypothetical protein